MKKITRQIEDEVFNKTIHALFPLFDEWVKKFKGHHTSTTTAEGIILWYEFLEFVKSKK